MVKLIVLLRARTVTSEAFAEGYNAFLMGLEKLPGIRKKSVSTVYGATGGPTPYHTVVEVFFDNREALEAALTSPEGIAAGQMLVSVAGTDTINLFADVLEEAYPADE